MALKSTHNNWTHGSYNNDRDYSIKKSENAPLLKYKTKEYLGVEEDGGNNPGLAIGYGYDLKTHYTTIQDDLDGYLESGVSITDWQVEVLKSWATGSKIENPYPPSKKDSDVNPSLIGKVASRQDVENEWSDIYLASEEKASDLLDVEVDKFEEILTSKLGKDDVPKSRERAALISQLYNMGSIPSTISIIKNNGNDPGQRANVWYQMRFKSNLKGSNGIQNRRDRESAMFGLYQNGNAPKDDEEAKAVLYVLNKHRSSIVNDMADLGRSVDVELDSHLRASKVLLGKDYANGKLINSVIVGTTTDYEDKDGNQLTIDDTLTGTKDMDLIFGQDGNDVVHAKDKDDYIYGGSGDDLLSGGDADDLLVGGSGEDTLKGADGLDLFKADKDDIIVNGDDNGRVYLGNLVLGGGTRKNSDPKNVYHDKRGNEYVLNGTKLIVNGGLVIKNYHKDKSSLSIVLRTKDDDDDGHDPGDGPNLGPAEHTVSPIVIDLDGDGITTLPLGACYFDLNGDKLREDTAWVGPQDGFLVLDRNGNGTVDDGTELFGNATMLSNGTRASNGFQALAALDDNGDKVINAQDASYQQLQVWRDLDSDGVSDPGELLSLADAGVVSINLDYTQSGTVDAHGNERRYVADVTLDNGVSSSAADIWFKTDPEWRVNSGRIKLPLGVLSLPNARGFGHMHDLHQAMALDPGLKSLLHAYVSADGTDARSTALDKLIYSWAGVEDVDPHSRDRSGHHIDARRIETLEQLVGVPYVGKIANNKGYSNPLGNAAAKLNAEYLKFKSYTAAEILAQTQYADVLGCIRSTFGSEAEAIDVDWQALHANLDQLYDQGAISKLSGVINVLRNLGKYSSDYRDRRDAAFQSMADSDIHLAPFFDFSTIVGSTKNDVLYGVYDGSIFYGNSGDDYMYGRGNNDTYHFERGDGNDVVLDAGGFDQIMFGSGIDAGDIQFSRTTTSVTITIKGADGTTDGSLCVEEFFDYHGAIDTGALEKIVFADGATLDQQQILAKLQADAITPDDDLAFGTASHDTIAAQGGMDTVHGLAGDDQLEGDDGADLLIGGEGNDSLKGDSGADTLTGGPGEDTYHFASGHGRDVIENRAPDGKSGTDRVVFGEGVEASSVKVQRTGNDLWLHGAGQDSVLLRGYFEGQGKSGTAVDEIMFQDGTVWSIDDVKAMVLQASAGGDVIKGYDSSDAISGLAGDDRLEGFDGDDTLEGGADDDTIRGDRGNDRLLGGDGQDFLLAGAGIDHLDGGNEHDRLQGGVGDDVLVAGTGNDVARGGAGRDALQGGTGADSLEGGAGNDTLTGGHGDDTLQGGTGANCYVFARGDGRDVIDDAYQGPVTIALAELSLDSLVFRRSGSSLVVRFQDSPEDQITLEAYFDGDTPKSSLKLELPDGSETIIGPSQLQLLTLKGTQADDPIEAYATNDAIQAQGGNDTVHAAAGDDTVHGGNDDDRLYGEAGHDQLFGGLGADALDGGAGTDSLSGGDGGDQLYGRAGNDNLAGQAGADQLFGHDGNDTLQGGAEADQLHGGAGKDSLQGGVGDDTYVVDNSGDTVVEAAGEGTDTIHSSVDYTLSSHVENMVLTGTGATDATGNALDNTLTGSGGSNHLKGMDGADHLLGNGSEDTLEGGAGDDVLDGGTGSDSLVGGTGADVYNVDTPNDQIVEDAGDGYDVVQATSNYTLSDNIEKLVLVDGSSAYDGTGNSGNNTIVGNAHDNTLDGGAGVDTLTGGQGYDTYVVDNAGDTIVEQVDQGNDTVRSSITWTLGNTLENLTLLGTANLDGTGNDKDNRLVGNAGDNRLDGGTGADVMSGGQGDDYYIVGSSGDRVHEGAGEGNDTVERRYDTNLVLASGVENLILADGITTGNGNGLDNTVTGNAVADTLAGLAGDDTVTGLAGDDALFGAEGADHLDGGDGKDYLDGGAGIDTLTGGQGNDTYIVNQSGDVVVEQTGQGTDAAQATTSYVLAEHVENLFLMSGSGAINGAGNGLANYLSGNDADNVIQGMGGADTMADGQGVDTLVGGTGDDKYVLTADAGTDVIDNSDGGFDGIFFADSVTRDQLSFARDGNDLLILSMARPSRPCA